MRKLAAPLVLLVSSGLLASAQQPAMSARDAFWSASDLVSVTPNPAAKENVPPSPPKESALPRATKDEARAAPQPARTRTASVAKKAGSGPGIASSAVTENGYGTQPHLLRTAADRLGLRYSLLQKKNDDGYVEASPSATFHSGDRVRLAVMTNQPGYLYVIQQGSSGAWAPIFPSAKTARDANHIEQGRVYQVPTGGAFQFDQHPGDEKLFLVLSREPIADLDRVIFKLGGPEKPTAATPAPATGDTEQLEVASNHIPDALVQGLASRDLVPVEEKVDDSSGKPDGGEKAVYVVSRVFATGTSRVVAKVTLKHE